MDAFVWKASFELGFEDIDRQHRQLLDCLNHCIESPVNNGGVFEQLKTYVTQHFSVEEQLMQLVSFPELERHRQEHRFFERQIGIIETAGMQGEAHAKPLLAAFLRDWYLNHVLSEDKKYADFIGGTLSRAEIADLSAHGYA